MLTMEYVCFSSKNPGEKKTVQVSGSNVAACREAAMAQSGLDRVESARVISGDIEPEISSGALRKR